MKCSTAFICAYFLDSLENGQKLQMLEEFDFWKDFFEQ